jgi:outer membrane protein OmpA-like peptidoglycan-associated protein
VIITAETPIREILRDRRDAEELDESELRYRIRARRDFETSQQFRDYDEEQRQLWREQTRAERRIMRMRLEQERDSRRVERDKPANIRRIVIEDDREFVDEEFPEDIFAAEVEDSDIERALLAAPRKKVIRKIKADDIASNPEARKALTRIEIDTIRFGFNEAFVREEEVDNLDQIASVIESILAKYPREVFLIEGHTDAIGSDAYNAKLSKARAEAVKKALSTYYIIPAKNLQTVGLGERYLKIPTAEAEQENRRVSLSRATAVIGELDE